MVRHEQSRQFLAAHLIGYVETSEKRALEIEDAKKRVTVDRRYHEVRARDRIARNMS